MMKRRFLTAMLILFAALLSLTGTAFADEVPTGEIQVVKLWQGDSADERPESVTVRLYADGELKSSISLSGDKASLSWMGSFGMQPIYRSGGAPVSYTIEEESPDGYSSSVTQQPELAALSLSSWGDKVTPASSSVYPIDSDNMLVAKKGGEYFVWTRASLDLSQQEQLVYLINAASLQGLGKELSIENTQFRSGLPAVFEGSGVSINGSAGNVSVEFDTTNSWSLFYTGLLGIRQAQEGRIENALRSPAPMPSPSVSPTPVPGPADTISLSVKKLWLDRDSSVRPDSAQVALYKDGEMYETISLSAENGWQHTWDALDADADWTVMEADVPQGYSSTVQRSDGGFIITNISKDIPATGDVSAFEFYTVTGIACLMLLFIAVSLPLLFKKKGL